MANPLAVVTGFEPYGGQGLNPSADVVKAVDGRTFNGVSVVGRTFPVDYAELVAQIDGLLDELRPVIVISLGLWPGEPMIRLERIGVNVASFDISDNLGVLIEDEAVRANAPNSFLATLPLRTIESALIDAGIPTRISSTAGTFLCNATLGHL